MIELNEERLKQLLFAEQKLIALENGGVDNWEFYDIASENIGEIDDIDVSKYVGYKEKSGKYRKGEKLFYNNNPCEFICYMGRKTALIVIDCIPKFDNVRGDQWCNPCQIGGKESHVCDQYDDVIEALKDEEPDKIPLIVDIGLLHDKPPMICNHEKEIEIINAKIKEQKDKLTALINISAELTGEIEKQNKIIEMNKKIQIVEG